jgi:hypothetical protein
MLILWTFTPLSSINTERTEQNQITLFGMHPWTTLKRLLATPCSLTFKWKARYEVPDFLLETQNLRTNAKTIS